jgi:hypothetical protein
MLKKREGKMLKKMLRWSAVVVLFVAITLGVNSGGSVRAEINGQEVIMGGIEAPQVIAPEIRYLIDPNGIVCITWISADTRMSDERLQQLCGEVISNEQLDQFLKSTDPSKVQRILLAKSHCPDIGEGGFGSPVPPGVELPPGPPEGLSEELDSIILP